MGNFDSITFVISISVSFLIVLIESRRIERQLKADLQKEYVSKFNMKRWESYLGMNDLIQGIYYKGQNVEGGELNLEDKIRLMRTQILLIGSNDVIKAFGFWQKQRQHGDYLEETKERLHNLIEEMRKDLGLQESKFDLEVMQTLFPRRR